MYLIIDPLASGSLLPLKLKLKTSFTLPIFLSTFNIAIGGKLSAGVTVTSTLVEFVAPKLSETVTDAVYVPGRL